MKFGSKVIKFQERPENMFPIFFQLSTPPPSKVLNIITQLLVENSDEFSVNFVRGFKYVPYISRTTHTHVNAPHTCLLTAILA